MAMKSTIIKVNLQIADMERHYYQDHDGQVWLGNGDESVMIALVTLKAPPVCVSVSN